MLRHTWLACTSKGMPRLTATLSKRKERQDQPRFGGVGGGNRSRPRRSVIKPSAAGTQDQQESRKIGRCAIKSKQKEGCLSFFCGQKSPATTASGLLVGLFGSVRRCVCLSRKEWFPLVSLPLPPVLVSWISCTHSRYWVQGLYT